MGSEVAISADVFSKLQSPYKWIIVIDRLLISSLSRLCNSIGPIVQCIRDVLSHPATVTMNLISSIDIMHLIASDFHTYIISVSLISLDKFCFFLPSSAIQVQLGYSSVEVAVAGHKHASSLSTNYPSHMAFRGTLK